MNIVNLENTIGKVIITWMCFLTNDENDVIPVEVIISTTLS